MSSNADEIRQYAGDHWVKSARNGKERTFSIITGDVHRGLGLRDLHPNVCSALASKKFLDTYGLDLIDSEGPPSLKSSTVKYTYSFREREPVTSKEPANSERSSVGRDSGAGGKSSEAEAFYALRGLFKGVFDKYGGGEEYLRREREEFDKSVSAYRPEDGRER